MLDRSWLSRIRLSPRRPEGFLVAGFLALILLGAALLALPWAHRPGAVTWLDALFTATSAACVTGLVVVDTATAYTPFGQLIVLVLIQMGGLGVMTFAAVAFDLFGLRLSLRAQAALHDSLLQRDLAGEFRHTFRRILQVVLSVELLGAGALYCAMVGSADTPHAAYSAVFHSISAFCNAGFSLYSDNLMRLRHNPGVMITTMVLIVLGGLGHPVLVELGRLCRHVLQRTPRGLHPLSLHARVTLLATLVLLVAGALALAGLGLTEAEHGWAQVATQSVFQSVTARTAGFNTVDIGRLPLASLLVLTALMFVGGSPGSCAGGVKTTTVALWLSQLRSWLRGDKWPRLLGRHMPGELTRRALLLLGLASLWNLCGILLLAATESQTSGVLLQDILFEQISAFGTVGLSTGLTPKLSVPGRLWVVLTMFIGRVGPLTLMLWGFERKAPGVRYPEGRIMIG